MRHTPEKSGIEGVDLAPAQRKKIFGRRMRQATG